MQRAQKWKHWTGLALLVSVVTPATFAEPGSADCTKFVHATNGSGKTASIEKPARDLGNIISRLEAGDVICIAQGEYKGRGGSGVDEINLPVSVIGGFSPDFTYRDPWGAHKTIFTGEHNSKNFKTQTRLSIDTSKAATKLMKVRGEPTAHTIVVDGIIFDNGPRNYYKTADQSLIVRKGTPSDTPTPESGALTVRTGVDSQVFIRNNIAINFAPTEGVFSLFGGQDARVLVQNNAAINNTGAGFRIGTNYVGEGSPTYLVVGNLSAFNQKHTAFGTFGGSGIMLESGTSVSVINNMFAFNDNYGIDNTKRSPNLVINGNIIGANAKADFVEFDLETSVEYIEDEADLVEEASNNQAGLPRIEISEDWFKLYTGRNVIDRNAAEADVRAVDSWQNDVRGFFGWNLQAADLDLDSPVWLPRFPLEDAVPAALSVGMEKPEAADETMTE